MAIKRVPTSTAGDKPDTQFRVWSANPCQDLMELMFFVPQGYSKNDFLLGAETRFGSMTVYMDDFQRYVEFGLTKSILRVDTQGCAIAPGARFADQSPPSIRTKVSVTKADISRSGKSASAKINADLSNRRASAGISGDLAGKKSHGHETKETSAQIYQADQRPVVALSGNRWEFSAVGPEIMRSRYSGDETLCKVEITSSKFKITGNFSFFPKDLFIIEGECRSGGFADMFRRSPNKVALAQVLLAKHLRELNPSSPDRSGPIRGCVATVEGDVKET
jgi:hypothetical protein